jgi:hypothetical protein
MAHEGKQRKIIVLLADWQGLGGGVWPETRMSLGEGNTERTQHDFYAIMYGEMILTR